MQSETDSDEPSGSNQTPIVGPAQPRRASSSPASSQLHETSPSPPDDLPRRPFQPFHTEGSSVPTGLQIDRYARDYSLHVDYLARYRAGATTEGAFSASHPFGTAPSNSHAEQHQVPPTNVSWSDQEKSRLFGSLARRSRWRPDLISRDMGGSKSEAEVGWYLDALRILSEIERAKRPDRGTRERSIWQDGFAPAAREVSSGWVEREEELARGLVRLETAREAEKREEARRAEFALRTSRLRKVPTYKDAQGKNSLLLKTALRKEDYQDRLEQGKQALKHELDEDVYDFTETLTMRKLQHLSVLLLSNDELELANKGPLDQPDLVDEQGCISVETMRAIQQIWQADETRLGLLNSIDRDRWTVQEMAEAATLQSRMARRKREIKSFDKWVELVETETTTDQSEPQEVSIAGDPVMERDATVDLECTHGSIKQESATQGMKRKRRQRRSLPDGNVKKKHKAEDTPMGEPPGKDFARNDVKVQVERVNRSRDYLLTRDQLRPLLSQIYEDVSKTAVSERHTRHKELEKIESYHPNKRAKLYPDQVPVILKEATARLKEEKLDMFNLGRLAPRVGRRAHSSVDSISASVLQLLYAHLDVFLHRLLMRVIYVGEGYAASRPGLEDDLRLSVNAQVVFTAMEQIGLARMIPPKENKWKYLEPFTVRHMLPSLPAREGEAGNVAWAEDVVPNVARGIINPSYGRVVLPGSSRQISGEDDKGLETEEEAEAEDELAKQVEQLQDRLDTLRDREHEDHLDARFNTDLRGLNEVPMFAERFDWSVYEAETGYITRLRKNWKVDEGTLRNSSGRKAKIEGDQSEGDGNSALLQAGEGNAEHETIMHQEQWEDEPEEDTPAEQPSDHARAVEIAQLEKERITLLKKRRRHSWRAARFLNVPDRKAGNARRNKSRPPVTNGLTFKSLEIINDTSEDEIPTNARPSDNERLRYDAENDNYENDIYDNDNTKRRDQVNDAGSSNADENNDLGDIEMGGNPDDDDQLDDPPHRSGSASRTYVPKEAASPKETMTPMVVEERVSQRKTTSPVQRRLSSSTSPTMATRVRPRTIDLDSDADRTDSE